MSADFIIIESLDFDDEDAGRFEGKALKKYLEICKFKCEYHYIRTKKELVYLAENMNLGPASLFISCHGNEKCISTTLDKEISFREFAKIFSSRLNRKKVLGSFCLSGRVKFARALYEENNEMACFIAPTEKVPFESTYPFWTTFCYLLKEQKANIGTLKNILSVCSHLFNMNMAYFPRQWWEGKVKKPLLFDPSTITEEDCETYAALIKKVNEIE